MGKIGKIKEIFKRKRAMSLKWSFALYLPLCFIISYIGSMAIGVGTNYLQDWYRSRDTSYTSKKYSYQYEIYTDEDNNPHISFVGVPSYESDHVYWIISNTQVLLIPLWVMWRVFKGVRGSRRAELCNKGRQRIHDKLI